MSQRDTAPRRISGQKQNTFFGGAAILAVGILVVKLIGMFYKIPLVNIIGEQGNTDFTNAYNIYAVLLTISTAGLPVAVSKLVSEASALGRHNQMRKTFRVSMLLFLSLGLVSFLVMYFKADTLAAMMNDTKAARRHQGAGSRRSVRGLSGRLPGVFPGTQRHGPHLHLPDH